MIWWVFVKHWDMSVDILIFFTKIFCTEQSETMQRSVSAWGVQKRWWMVPSSKLQPYLASRELWWLGQSVTGDQSIAWAWLVTGDIPGLWLVDIWAEVVASLLRAQCTQTPLTHKSTTPPHTTLYTLHPSSVSTGEYFEKTRCPFIRKQDEPSRKVAHRKLVLKERAYVTRSS